MTKKNDKGDSLPNIEALADLAKIALTPSEMKQFQPQIQDVLDYFENLADLDSGTISDDVQSRKLDDIRDDEQSKFESSKIMNLAKSKKDGFVKGPRIA